jgi:hypothetical protein
MRVDVDAHVDETDATWDYLEPHEERGATGEIPAEVARKIVDDNPRRFYGL